MSKRRSFNANFKAKIAIEALKEQTTLNELAQKYSIHQAQISTWKSKAIEGLAQVFEDGRIKKRKPDVDLESLYAEIGKLKMQLEYLKKKLDLTTCEKRLLIESNHPGLSILAQCETLGLAKSSYYYTLVPESIINLSLMKRIEEIHYQYPAYGYRKVHADLRREGYQINEKRIERLWKLLGYCSLLPKPNLSQPTKSHPIYPYLLNDMWIVRPNQVFSSDITFIPTINGFVYLVMVIDWFSRYILSWEISNTMSEHFCLEALENALLKAVPEYFNTDQGSQFTGDKFLKKLLFHSIKISMDGRGRAIDNVYMERGWWSLKYEDIYLKQYEQVPELIRGISNYVNYFNTKRPHQGLRYATPYEIYNEITPKYSRGKYMGFKVKCAK